MTPLYPQGASWTLEGLDKCCQNQRRHKKKHPNTNMPQVITHMMQIKLCLLEHASTKPTLYVNGLRYCLLLFGKTNDTLPLILVGLPALMQPKSTNLTSFNFVAYEFIAQTQCQL